MASMRAHAVSFLMRHTYKPRLARAQGVMEVRRLFGSVKQPLPAGTRAQPAVLGGVPGEWVLRADAPPKGDTDAPVLLYLHGGGYVGCSPETHRPFTGWFARAGFRVFAPDYRLAPEHPFPAAVEDAVAVHEALLERGAVPGRLAVAGDSAGGGLTLALLLALKEKGRPLPAAAALFSPLTDLKATGASIVENDRRDAMFRGANIGKVAKAYLNATAADHPLASPLYGDLSGLPPLLIHVGAEEVLRDDSTRLAEKARKAGTAVELKLWSGVPHVWQLAWRFLPEARQSLDEAGRFLNHRVVSS